MPDGPFDASLGFVDSLKQHTRKRMLLQSIDKVDALPSKVCKQSFDGCINLL